MRLSHTPTTKMAVGAYNSMAGEPSALEFESPDSPTAPVLIADRPRRP